MTRRWMLVLVFALSGAVQAADGRLEINQACAENTGCFPGDAAGFPVTISAPGSYVLTSGLQVPNADTTAIDLTGDADGATIDLNGFRIQGVTSCSPISQACTPSGSGVGIRAAAQTTEVRVLNGTVSGMGAHGVLLQNRDYVHRITAISNGGPGIEVGARSSVIESQALLNGGSGIVIHESTSTTFGNAGESLLSGNLAALNAIVDVGGLDIQGGRSAGGNVCADNHCALRDARRYYLTAEEVNGANALDACTRGYHMASMYELFDTSNLQYAVVPQRNVATWFDYADRGSGPPSETLWGWVRTGKPSGNSVDDTPGRANCNAWTSTAGEGSAMIPKVHWTTVTAGFGAWEGVSVSCASTAPVWCIED